MDSITFKPISKNLPRDPGVYRFYDKSGKLLYVGKAKNLKNRVSSYFRDTGKMGGKLTLLVKKTSHIEFTIVSTEKEALLLENTLIKQYQPKYNVNLRDDKTYPFICIKNERFPRIFLTRKKIQDGSEYYGPYTSVAKVRSILNLAKNIFPLRTCNLNLSERNIEKGKYKICLEYHIGNCLGPCEGLQPEKDYNNSVEQIRNLLKGNLSPVKKHLLQQIKEYAEQYEFEKANTAKVRLEALRQFEERSAVVNPSVDEVDVFTIAEEGKDVFVNYLQVRKGAVIQAKTLEMERQLEEPLEELLIFSINELRQQYNSTAKNIIVPFKIDFPDEELKILVPERGDKKKLLELSASNTAHYMRQRQLRKYSLSDKNSLRILTTVKEDFQLDELPVHIECFDNSNIQGTTPVASVVVFKNARPSKKDYRHFNVKTVEGANDFASMEEIVFRRYYRIVKENEPLPQLVIIDGGKGQLNAALKSIEKLGLKDKFAVAGIAKRLEEIYFPGDPVPLHLDKRSESLKLIQRLRNEAHRFAINFHRQKRDKKPLHTGLTQIEGVGAKTAEKLLRHFKSVKKVKEASLTEIAALIGTDKAKKVMEGMGR